MNITMNARDSLSAKEAECFITIGNKRYNAMNAINVEAHIDKDKVEVPVLGRRMKGHKTVGLSGSGSATFHYNQTVMRQLLADYKDTGIDPYFEMQITNDDKTSNTGRQTIVLMDCNTDGGILAKFDADGGTLDEDMNFTFEDFKIPESFTLLNGLEA